MVSCIANIEKYPHKLLYATESKLRNSIQGDAITNAFEC